MMAVAPSHPYTRAMRWIAFSIGLAITLPAWGTQAQDEGAGALAAPTARDGSRPSATLEDVPPPPEEGYQEPQARYPGATNGETPAGLEFESDDPGVRIPSRTATRLRVVGSSLRTLAARGGNKLVDGILSLTSGALVIGIAGWQWSEDKQLGGYLLLYGVANIARGLIDLILTPNASRYSIEFTHMPRTSLGEVEAALAFGERSLEQMAKRTRLARILDASLNIGVGAAVIPLYLAPNDFEIDDPFDYFVIIGSGISIISGLISLATRSDAERRWQAYQELRDRLEREETARLQFRRASPVVLRGGAMLSTDWTF